MNATKELIRDISHHLNFRLDQKDEVQLEKYISKYKERIPKEEVVPPPRKLYPAERIVEILKEVCRVFSLTTEQILKRDRHDGVVIPRHIFFFVSRNLTTATLKHIGEFSAERDHSTVVHSAQSVKDWLESEDPKFMAYWETYMSRARPEMIPDVDNLKG